MKTDGKLRVAAAQMKFVLTVDGNLAKVRSYPPFVREDATCVCVTPR